ncbi:MAG: cation diffusion facilitator family transporter [Acidobacteriota bacterium]
MTLAHLHASRVRDRRTMLIVGAITSGTFVIEVVGGLVTGSLALLADAGHMFTDILALLMAFAALVLASRPATARKTWGYHRAEILSAFVNGVLLLALSAGILWQASERLAVPRDVASGGMALVASIGLLANVTGVWLLSRSSRSLNVRGAFWHLFGDTISSVGVLVGGVAIAITGVTRIDAVVSIGISLIILYGAGRLVWEASDVLLESVPGNVDSQAVQDAIGSLPGVVGVRDLHIWSITTGLPALSGHVIIPNGSAAASDEILNTIKKVLNTRFGIAHSTIQVQTEDYREVAELH